MPRLIMRRGPTPNATYELMGERLSIGRGSKNQIIIHDNEVSREHCSVHRVADAYTVHDHNSSNGTFVNGQRVIGSWLLEPGSLIELGDSITLEYETARAPRNGIDRETEPFGEAMEHQLVMTMGPSVGEIYPLNAVIITIGRDLSNDVVIQDLEVSRYHLRLRRMKNGYNLEDMGSTNGTLINGENWDGSLPHHLAHEDVIRLGTSVMLQFIAAAVNTFKETEPFPSADDVAPDWDAEESRALTSDMMAHRDDTLYSALIRGVRSPIKTSRLGNGLEPGTLSDHVFIAYTRDDWEHLIAALTISMQDAGVNVWVDQYLVQGSDDWRAAIEQALIECRMMILVATPSSLTDNYVKLAYRHALRRGQPLTLLTYGIDLPLQGDLASVRAIPYDPENPRRSFHKLVFEIMQGRRA